MNIKKKVIAEIRKIYDPEIPINIYELGLIYDVKVKETKVKIIMTLTSGFFLSFINSVIIEADAIEIAQPCPSKEISSISLFSLSFK